MMNKLKPITQMNNDSQGLPVEIQFSKILDNGLFHLDYSETLRKIEEIFPGAKNLTLLNEYRHLILELIFE